MATNAPSESTFSRVDNIITKKRNRLLASTIKQIVLLKDWKIIEDEESTILDNEAEFVEIEENITSNSILNSQNLKQLEFESNKSSLDNNSNIESNL